MMVTLSLALTKAMEILGAALIGMSVMEPLSMALMSTSAQTLSLITSDAGDLDLTHCTKSVAPQIAVDLYPPKQRVLQGKLSLHWPLLRFLPYLSFSNEVFVTSISEST